MVEGRGCRSYLLTYELVQTQVDIETPQMVVKQWSVGTACILKPLPLIVTFCNGLNMLLLFFIFLFLYIQSCSFPPPFFIFLDWIPMEEITALVHWFIGCYLQTNSNRLEIDTHALAVQSLSLWTCETARSIFGKVRAALPLTGSHGKLFVLCKWWLMTCLAQPAVFDKKYWWLLSVKC